MSAAEEAAVPEASPPDESASESAAEFGTHEINKIVTCLIIKPDIAGNETKLAEIIELIELNGLEILLDQTREITENEVDKIFQV